MSILRSYYSRNNTIQQNSFVNTGRNPVTQLYFGEDLVSFAPNGFTRFIFDLDLDLLRQKIATGDISTGCTPYMTHTLTMTNTSSFDEMLLNDTTSDGSRRAESFDLILFRIPTYSGSTGSGQTWDEGVGFDYVDVPAVAQWGNNQAFSTRPSNWYQRTTITDWSQPGLYDNTNSLTGLTGLNYSAITIVDRQHFEYGNEDIDFDMSNEINNLLSGATTGVTGWGVAYVPEIENITGLTEDYSVGFFTRHTQTFYQPFLQTTYDDLILDDRNTFVSNKFNKLYLYIFSNGDYKNLDSLPTVDILDPNGDPIPDNASYSYTGLTTCLKTRGVYEVTIPPITGYTSPCQFNDVWTDLVIDGVSLTDVENSFILQSTSALYQIGSVSKDPVLYGFDFSGIKQNEKILNTDVRKVMVTIKQAYTSQFVLQNIDAYYRVYVKEGTTEVQVQDWTQINRTPNEYYFIFDTRDKIPNQYYVDIQVNTSGEKDTYQRQLTFEIVNKK
jgi:hypothetical protein